jgi:hypothetical protein
MSRTPKGKKCRKYLIDFEVDTRQYLKDLERNRALLIQLHEEQTELTETLNSWSDEGDAMSGELWDYLGGKQERLDLVKAAIDHLDPRQLLIN